MSSADNRATTPSGFSESSASSVSSVSSPNGAGERPATRKTYLTSDRSHIRVPMREVVLTSGDAVVLYDTSGPYTDPDTHIDVHRGLAPLRSEWIHRRGADGHPTTQLARARGGEITPEMEFVALREGVSGEYVRGEIAAGRAVLPANRAHPETEPMIIGRAHV